MTISFVDLDVRPILRDGGEPFELIMQAVNALGPDQGLRLLATFQPVPLFHMMGSKGFTHGTGWWRVGGVVLARTERGSYRPGGGRSSGPHRAR